MCCSKVAEEALKDEDTQNIAYCRLKQRRTVLAFESEPNRATSTKTHTLYLSIKTVHSILA